MRDDVFGNNGTLQGSATTTTGKVNQAFDLNGNAGTYVHLATNANLSVQDFTIDAWVKRSNASMATNNGVATGGRAGVFAQDTNGYGFGIFDDGRLDLTKIGVSEVVSSALIVADTNYHHIAVTKSGSTVIFYLDGVAETVAPYNAVFSFNANGTDIGRFASGGGEFFGQIDEVEFFDRALTGTEVQGIYNASTAGICDFTCYAPPTEMRAWFKGQGDANDVFGNNGTFEGDANATAIGRVGQAFSFDGNGDAVQTAPATVGGGLPTSIDAWVKPQLRSDGTDFPTNAVSIDFPLEHGHGFGANVWSGGSQLTIEYNNGFRTVPGVSFDAGRWYHIAVVYSTGNAKTYVDGALVDDFNFSQGVLNAATPIRIGKHNDDAGTYGTRRFFKGEIDEVEVFAKALSAAEILGIYTASPAGKCPLPTYTLTVNAGTGGGTTPSGATTVSRDVPTPILATPSVGYAFVNWTVPVGSATFANANLASTTVAIGTDATIQANFAINTYTLTYTAGANGMISGTSPQTVNYGASGTAVTAVPNAGYHFVNWSDSSTSNPRTDMNVMGDITVMANFAVDVCTAPPAGMISWYPADGDAGDIFGANNGTAVGDVSYVAGKVGQAFSFDGDGDYITIPDSASLHPTDLTIDGWFRFNHDNGVQVLVAKNAGVSQGESFIMFKEPGNLGAALGGPFGFGTIIRAPLTPTAGTWYHLTYTFNDAADTQTLYIDGELAATGVQTTSMEFDSKPLTLGAEYENNVLSYFFSGSMDEVEIFGRDIDASEVAALYNAGAAGKCKFYHTLTLNSVNGTVTQLPNRAQYLDGSTVDLTATPDMGYSFVDWTGAVTNVNSNPTTVVMTADKTVTANFADLTPPAAPFITGSTPTSPNASTTPTINGSAEANSTITLYKSSNCTGAVAGTGTATGGTFAIGTTVGPNATTTFTATATDAASNVSPCSGPVLISERNYLHDRCICRV